MRTPLVEQENSSVALELADELRAFIARSVAFYGGSVQAKDPGRRVKFHWPPHPESYGHHVLPSDWTGRSTVEIDGETFAVEIAKSPKILFGRIPELWFEAKGADLEDLHANLVHGVEPLLARQKLIAQTLEQRGRFKGKIGSLPRIDLLKLFYCPDRDIANEGRQAVETQASCGLFLNSLLVIITDETHPYRRSAQWAALDLFEDLGSFCRDYDSSVLVTGAIKSLIWNAEDDYARTIYKAGVVLGGHFPYGQGGEAVMECLRAPSRIGRRSAIHGCFHLAEWAPEKKETILDQLEEVAQKDAEPRLREYAAAMMEDIQRGEPTHVEDVLFPEEILS